MSSDIKREKQLLVSFERLKPANYSSDRLFFLIFCQLIDESNPSLPGAFISVPENAPGHTDRRIGLHVGTEGDISAVLVSSNSGHEPGN